MPSIDGLASGLNTTQIISQLMTLERRGQVRLQQTVSRTQNAITALRSLNTSMLALKTASDTFTTTATGGWDLRTATSSDATRASVSTKPGAQAGEVTFAVRQLASFEVQKTSGTVADLDTTVVADADFTITKDGTTTTVSRGDGTLGGVVASINAADAGVRASAVQVSPGQYTLQLTSTTSGDTAISVATTSSLGGSPFTGGLGTPSVVTNGADAELQVGVAADGSGGYLVTRTSNTFSDLLQGTTITLLQQDATTPVTVRSGSDTAGIADGVAKMVDAANAALAEIARTGSYNPTTKTAGILQGEGAVRSIRNSLANAVTGSTTSTPGLAGVSVQRDGTIGFDRAKFLAALEKDPATVQAALGKDGMAGRLHAVADAATRPASSAGGSGLITNAIASRERSITGLNTNIRGWDQRLELREQRLIAQFTALEKALASAQSQGQWLAGQIAGLPRYGS